MNSVKNINAKYASGEDYKQRDNENNYAKNVTQTDV